MTTMDNDKYLKDILEAQTLKEDSEELKKLQQHRKDVEAFLRERFSASSPTIRYGGSIAKGTLVREAYDLDIICYFPHDDTDAGDTLKDIYQIVKDALAEKYEVEPKTSAIRLRSRSRETLGQDFHIDVVPGRYTDDSKTDCFLHQEGAEKERLKTNLEVHIDYVKESGVVDALRLLKLWRVRKALGAKQFVFELLGIKLLKDKTSEPLSSQLKHFWKEIASAEEAVAIEDPANPKGNDLMPLLRGVWADLRSVAKSTLRILEESGWEGVFGSVEKSDQAGRVSRLSAAAAAVSRPTKPWAFDE
jgi:hypothetical protein